MNLVPNASGFAQPVDVDPIPVAYRDVAAELAFVRGGGRTVLARQRVPYPFHITRPFALDRELPELATIYLQSASGGLYRGDRLRLDIRAGTGAMAHLTSQAATVVNRTPGSPARLATSITVENGAFLALTNDPFILFPEADFRSSTEVMMAPGARGIISDGIATHDPLGLGRPFERLETRMRVVDDGGRLIATDRGTISGRDFAAPGSPLGSYRAMGNMLVLGRRQRDIDPRETAEELDAIGCCIGLGELPNDGGLVIRCLARNGGQLSRGLDKLFGIAFEALIGIAPARRRK